MVSVSSTTGQKIAKTAADLQNRQVHGVVPQEPGVSDKPSGIRLLSRVNILAAQARTG